MQTNFFPEPCQLPVNLISECPVHHTCILSVSEGFWLLWNWIHHGSFSEVCLLSKTVFFLQAGVLEARENEKDLGGWAPVLHVLLGFWYKVGVCSMSIIESGLLKSTESAGNFRTGGPRGWSWGRENYSWILVCKLCVRQCVQWGLVHMNIYPRASHSSVLYAKRRVMKCTPSPKTICVHSAMQTCTFYFYLFSLPRPSFIPILFPICLHANKEIHVTLLSSHIRCRQQYHLYNINWINIYEALWSVISTL